MSDCCNVPGRTETFTTVVCGVLIILGAGLAFYGVGHEHDGAYDPNWQLITAGIVVGSIGLSGALIVTIISIAKCCKRCCRPQYEPIEQFYDSSR